MDASKAPFGAQTLAIYGPPGTGKTTRVLDLLDTELAAGVEPEEIAFVSFTRAATDEAAQRASDRFQLSRERLQWFRTLHSLAYRLLGLNRQQVYGFKHHKAFCERYHYRITRQRESFEDDWLGAPIRRTRDDDLRAVHEWGLHRMLSLEESWKRAPQRVSYGQLVDYVHRFEDFKTREGVADFNDMMILGMGLQGPRVLAAFVDEAQDLSPRQVEACRRWFEGCERVYIAGDEDQTLYSFVAADPTWLVDLKDQATCSEILEKSYRVPDNIRKMAGKIISKNRNRVKKPYKSQKPGGRAVRMRRSGAFAFLSERSKEPGWTGFVLIRNRIFARPILDMLVRAGVPFSSEVGGKSPLERKGVIKAYLAAKSFLDSKALSTKEIIALSSHVSHEFMPAHAETRARKEKTTIDRNRLILDWGLSKLVSSIEANGPAMALNKEPKEVRLYLEGVMKNVGLFPDPPPVSVMTMHGSKGREADTVVIVPDMAKASYEDFSKNREAENRVAYVAVTRAKEELIICDPEVSRHYPYLEYMGQKK